MADRKRPASEEPRTEERSPKGANPKGAPRKKKLTKKRKRLKTILYALAGVALAALVVFGVVLSYVIEGLPSLEELENPTPSLASKLYSSDGELVDRFFIENRIETPLDSIPDHFIDALIATEDRKFHDHWGVDLDRLIKAAIKTVFLFDREGASTLTQQLAKNLYGLKVQQETLSETLVRKMREWISAIQIERNFTKAEILEMYLNVSYFGRSAYGVQSAAKQYFGKDAPELTITESAMLVALLKSPRNYNPVANPDRALQRRNLVLYNMADAGFLKRDYYEKLKATPIVVVERNAYATSSEAPYFVEHVRQQMEDLQDQYDFDLYRDGLSIYTTVNMEMQRIANRAVVEHLDEFQKEHDQRWNWRYHQRELNEILEESAKRTRKYRAATDAAERKRILDGLMVDESFIDSVKKAATTVQAGFVVVEPGTGEIKAMVGGKEQKFRYGLNHTTQIRRQPGSSFKPFTYLTAIENGLYPAYPILNQPFEYKEWSPGNYGGRYGGYLTLRRALASSLNVVAGRLIVEGYAPAGQVVRNAKRMGIDKSELLPVPAISLGVSEVSPLEMATAYATLANDGVYVQPISILRVEDKNGVLIAEFKPERRQALSEQTNAVIRDMMTSVINGGTGSGVRRTFHRPAAGKTGTTQDYGDAWFCGFTPQLAAATWVGFDDMRVKFTSGSYGQGARAALPIWRKFFTDVYEAFELPMERFSLPGGVQAATFCKETIDRGEPRLAGEHCPETITDIIISKNLPPKCDLHTGYQDFEDDGTDDGSQW
jgi:penicillin-binding protein 1A